jgi:hypothetical protein
MTQLKVIRAFFTGIAILLVAPMMGYAQYFSAEHTTRLVMRSSGRDSVILQSMTPFEVPSVNDTVSLVYHEPMPDSIMPRSAIVIGIIDVQAEEAENVAPLVEKYARKLGADWIVSFQEPKAMLTADKWKVYRSKALLLHVLDDQFINQSNIEYSYYGPNHLRNYAAVSHWYDIYGKHLGSKLDQPEPVPAESGQDEQR